MSKKRRRKYAGIALQALLNHRDPRISGIAPTAVADRAFVYADAMLEAEAKPATPCRCCCQEAGQ